MKKPLAQADNIIRMEDHIPVRALELLKIASMLKNADVIKGKTTMGTKAFMAEKLNEYELDTLIKLMHKLGMKKES